MLSARGGVELTFPSFFFRFRPFTKFPDCDEKQHREIHVNRFQILDVRGEIEGELLRSGYFNYIS
jgi:hypothetical protein